MMITYKERRAYELRCLAEALEGEDRMVTVELSETAAWLLRDLLGLTGIASSNGVGLREDMERLNSVLGYREEKQPHISGWSKKAVDR